MCLNFEFELRSAFVYIRKLVFYNIFSSNALLRDYCSREMHWQSASNNHWIGMLIFVGLWAVLNLWCTSINNSAPIRGGNKDPIDCLFLPSGSLAPGPSHTGLPFFFFFVTFIFLVRLFFFFSPTRNYYCGRGPSRLEPGHCSRNTMRMLFMLTGCLR